MQTLKVMAFAAAYRKVGVVMFKGSDLVFCQTSKKAAIVCGYTMQFTQDMIDAHKPDVIITEDIEKAVHKSQHTKQVTLVMADVAQQNAALDVVIGREQLFGNKYEEAAHYASKYAQLLPLVPKPRRLFDKEPRVTVIFEAVALAETVRRNPTLQLAVAMG